MVPRSIPSRREAIKSGEGGRRQGDGQVRAASLSGGASCCPSIFPVAGGAGGQHFWFVASTGRTLQAWCRRRCRAVGCPGGLVWCALLIRGVRDDGTIPTGRARLVGTGR